jgi:hypothetical protein
MLPSSNPFAALRVEPFEPDLFQVRACQFRVLENFQKQAGADHFSGMNRNDSISPVLMAQGMVAPFDPDHLEPESLQNPDEFFSFESRKSRHGLDPDALDSDKVGGAETVLLVLEAELDDFPDPFHKSIQRLRLGMASPQIGDGCHKIALRILLNDHIKIA